MILLMPPERVPWPGRALLLASFRPVVRSLTATMRPQLAAARVASTKLMYLATIAKQNRLRAACLAWMPLYHRWRVVGSDLGAIEETLSPLAIEKTRREHSSDYDCLGFDSFHGNRDEIPDF